MNWKEIQKTCPKAFAQLIEKLNVSSDSWEIDEENDLTLDYGWRIFRTRDLYDFFDEQGIIIAMEHDLDFMKKFWWYINRRDGVADANYSANNRKDYLTRTEAESEAFTKAFEILENKLNVDYKSTSDEQNKPKENKCCKILKHQQ